MPRVWEDYYRLWLCLFKRCEQGSIAFHTLVLIPIVLSLTAVAIDVSAWHSLRNKAQQEADSLALRAAQFLPDKEAAQKYVSQISAHTSGGFQATAFFPENTNLSVGIETQMRYDGYFSALLPADARGSFEVRKTAVASLVPSDNVFIIADGASLRPQLLRNAGEISSASAWGESAVWPASGYFHCNSAPRLKASAGEFPWWLFWSDTEFQRWATQSCFNPVLSMLKLGVISVLDELLASQENRVGAIFTPGPSSLGFSILKRLKQDFSNSSEVFWYGTVEGQRFLGDETCLLFSHSVSALNSHFELPASRYPLQATNTSCQEPLSFSPCGGTHMPTGNIDSCFLENNLSLRQAVYWHAAQEINFRPQVLPALLEAIHQLQDVDFGANTQAILRSRGKLAYKANKNIVLLLDYLPALDDALSSALFNASTTNISVTFITFQHQGLSNEDQGILLARSQQLSRQERSFPGLRIFLASSPTELQSEVLPKLLAIDRNVILRS